MNTFNRKLWLVTKFVFKEYFQNGGGRLASSLAYSTLLAIVPLVLVSLSIASKIPAFSHVIQQIQDFIFGNFVAGAAGSVTTYMNEFIKQLGRLTAMNIVAFSLTAILLLYNMVAAFNKIWRVKMDFRREFTFDFLRYFSILLVAPLLLTISMLVISSVTSLSLFASTYFQGLVARPFLQVLPFIIVFLTFTFLNWVLPTCEVKWRYAIISGFISMVLFEIVKYGFTLYIQIFPTYRVIYGALATIPIFFIWVYVSWVITLFGAILCKGLQDQFHRYSHMPFQAAR